MKMRRSKQEMITATLESYLKRRRYQETDSQRKIDKANCQTCEEMTLSVAAESGSSRDNSILFSSISNDVVAADQAYQKLKAWINGLKNESVKSELRTLLYPIYAHVYLNILQNSNRQSAVQFMKNHQKDFQSESERDFLDELSSVFTVQDIEPRPLVNAFKHRKYKVNLSDESHICLQKFLSNHGHVIIMQTINAHITIVRNDAEFSIDETSNDEVDKANDSNINGHVEQSSSIGIDREMRELQEAIRLLKNPSHQPLRIFTINNAIENASCGIITENIDKLAAGFGTAEIRVWGIGDSVLTQPKFRRTEIPLACDSNILFEDTDKKIDEAGAIILRGHTDTVHEMRFIPEPLVLLSISSDNSMKAWDLKEFTCAAVYGGHNYPIWCMDISIFNWYMATGSHDRTARLWTLDRTFPLRIYAGHYLDVNCVRFHPNAQYLVTGSSDKTVRLWNKDSGNLMRVYVEAQEAIFSVAFSPDGRYLASGGDDKNIRIYDLSTNNVLKQIKGHQDSVTNLVWSPDGQFLASSSLDGVVNLWSSQDILKTDGISYEPQTYTTNCSSILSLRYYSKNNSLICIGTV